MKLPLIFRAWATVLSITLIGIPQYALAQDTAAIKKAAQDASVPAPAPAEPQGTVYQPANPPPQTMQPPPASPSAQEPARQIFPPRSGNNRENYDEYLRGKMDGKRDGRGRPAWILAGLAGTGLCICIGVAGIGLAFAVAPSPNEMELMGKSATYVQGYTEGYKEKGRIGNAGWATLGCAMAFLINVIVNLSMGYDPTATYQ